MGASSFIILLLLVAGIIWAGIRITIWIIKTAIKEALREYDAEKQKRYYGS